MGRADAVFAAAVLLAGCGGATRPQPQPGPSPAPSATVTATPTPPPPTPSERIETLLNRRADALAAGRIRTFASTSVRVEQGDDLGAARTAAHLGLRSVHYEFDRVDVHGRHADIRARLAYGVRGVTGDFGETRTLQTVRTAHGWRVRRSGGVRLADPWTLGAYRRIDTPHFVIWTPPDLTAPEATLEAGYTRMRDLIRQGRLRRRYLVIVARDPADARRLTGSIGGLEGVTAVTASIVHLTGDERRVNEVGALRFIIVADTFADQTSDGQQQVVIHELAHAILTPLTSGRVPSWLREGIAEYVSEDYRLQEAQFYRSGGEAPTLAALAAPDAIGRLEGTTQSAAYAVSAATAYEIAQRFGRDKLIKLYLVYNDPSLKGRTGDPKLTERAVRRVLGVSMADLGA
jgi:hypothetical protein